MALRKQYSLINSEFNEFLFAPVGDEGNGMTLSVMSALSRLDIDPWREAASLSALSKEKAVEALASIIARLPDARWAAADTREIAARLIAFLPGRDTVGPARAIAAGRSVRLNPRTVFLLAALAAVATLMFFAG
jgi:hypothetical protein